MRKLSAAFLIAAFTFFLALAFTPTAYPAPVRDDCSCRAPDGSCSASISCSRGCNAICNPGGDCVAYCSGYYLFLATEVTLQMENGTYPQLVSELARISGQDLAFSPSKPDTIFNMDSKRDALWNILVHLSDRGTVQVGGHDFEKFKRLRSHLRGGKQSSFCVKRTPVGTFVSDVAALTGLRLRITEGSPMSEVNLKLENVTLNEMLSAVSEQTGVTIVTASPDAYGR